MASMPDRDSPLDSALPGSDPLGRALSELAELGTERDRERLAALRDRLASARLRILVAGEAKRGKSTLINALLGREVLPSGVTPLTAVATTVRYGDDQHAEARFADGHEEKFPLAALPDLVTERGNPGNRRRITGVTVYLAAAVLEGGVELVDTPGTAGSLLDEVALTRRAAQLSAGEAAGRVEQFRARLAEVTVRGRDAVAVAGAESARLLSALNDSAGEDGTRLSREIRGQLDTVLDGELSAATPGEIERRGRERLAALAVAAARAWRQQQTEAIERGLAQVDARLAADLKTELGVLRESAAELLDLELAVPEPDGRLAESRRFFFAAAEDAGQTELLAGAVRRRLPGELGRRTAREHLRRELPDLVERQIGRARGDLQYRLEEASRALRRIVRQRYTDGTDRIRSALDAAAGLREASAADASVRERELAGREAALRHVTALLDWAATPS
jgi:predicted transcriptional regulator